MKKEIVEREIAKLVESWAAANGRAWNTVGRGGPGFTPGDLGDWDYVDAQWREHHAQIEAEIAAAIEKFWAALKAAPVWLRLSRPWVKEAWERAFISSRHGYYVGHSCMPGIQDVIKILGI